VKRIIVSKIARGNGSLRTSFRFTADEFEVSSEPISILTDTVEDFLANDVTIIVLEETTTNRKKISSLSVKDGSVVQVSEPLCVQETASDEHVSIVQPGGLPDIVVDTVILGGTHPDTRDRVVLADTIMLDTLGHIDGIIEDVAATHSVEDAGLVDHENTDSACKFFLESGAAIERNAWKTRKTLREVALIERTKMPSGAVTNRIPILNGVVPLGDVVGKVLMVGAEVNKGECTTDVDVSGSLGGIKQDAIDRKRMLLGQWAERFTHGEVFASRADANNLTRKIAEHFCNLLTGRRSDVKIASVAIPLKVLDWRIATTTITLDFKGLEVRHERRPGICSWIINTNALPSLRSTIDPKASLVPFHALRDGGEAVTTLSSLVSGDWPVSLLSAVAPHVPSGAGGCFPSTTHVEDVADPQEASDVRNTRAAVKTSLCGHWRSLRVTESTLPMFNTSVSGDINKRDDSCIVVWLILIRKRRTFLSEIDVRIPPGKELALKGAILTGLTTDNTESAVEDDIVRADDGSAADRHWEVAQSRAHLLPFVCNRIIDNTQVDVSTTSSSRVHEASESRTT